MQQFQAIDPNHEIVQDMASLYSDPLGFVKYAFPWGKRELLGRDLEEWQTELLSQLGNEITTRAFDGISSVDPIQFATSSGHGIGKSTMTAWLILFIMSTRPYAKGVVTANTSAQLATKTWAELGKWYSMCVTKHWFSYKASRGSMNLSHVDHPETWRVDAQTCREENSESFAGLHAVNSTPFYIFDEASAVPDIIWEVAEGGTTDGEPMWFVWGNPTRSTGRFRECFRKFRHRWTTRSIDSRSVSLTNKDRLDEWVKDYGEDSDFVKVRVRGEFPSSSFKQFISEELVEAAFKRHVTKQMFEFAPPILGVDPAWSGDDEFVIYLRQGIYTELLAYFDKNDNDFEMANIVARLQDEHKAVAVFVDGGFGTGIVSAGKQMGRSWQIVWFSGKPSDQGCLNKRAEMWNELKKCLADGGSMQRDDVLKMDLIGPELLPRMDGKIQLESKEDMKKRGLPSPNRADALALTFAQTVLPSANYEASAAVHDFDPYS